MSRPRAVSFTLNNYSNLEIDKIRKNALSSLRYCIFQLERGESGTPHIQGYAVSDNPKTFAGWKQLLGTRIHVESAKGSAEKNKAYCSKQGDGGRDETARPRLEWIDNDPNQKRYVKASEDVSTNVEDVGTSGEHVSRERRVYAVADEDEGDFAGVFAVSSSVEGDGTGFNSSSSSGSSSGGASASFRRRSESGAVGGRRSFSSFFLGDAGPYEYGVMPQQGFRSDLNDLARAAAQPSVPIEEVMQSNPEGFLKFHKGVYAIRALASGRRSQKTRVLWFYGPTGTGKSRVADAIAPDAYWKPGGTKWWCGYQPPQPVIIDDYRRDLCTFHELLRLLDRYPMSVEFKGGSVQFNSSLVIITTPKDPRGTWEGRTEEDLAQLFRRIECVCEYTPEGCVNVVEGALEDNEKEKIREFYCID